MIKGMFVFGCGMAVGTIYGTLLGFKIAEDAREKELIRAGAAFEKAKSTGEDAVDAVDAAKDVVSGAAKKVADKTKKKIN